MNSPGFFQGKRKTLLPEKPIVTISEKVYCMFFSAREAGAGLDFSRLFAFRTQFTHAVDSACAGCHPKRFSALLISATAAGTSSSQEGSLLCMRAGRLCNAIRFFGGEPD